LSEIHVGRDAHTILVRRDGAFGDVCCVTPITRRLRRENPGATIHVLTQYGAMFEGNPDVDGAGWGQPPLASYDRVIDLSGSFEKRLRKVNSVDCYMLDAFGDEGAPEDKDVFLAEVPLPDGIPDLNPVMAAVHPARSWRQRTMSKDFWENVARGLSAKGLLPVALGTPQDWRLESALDTTHCNYTPQQQAAIIRASRVLVASESGIMGGLLPATDTPGVGLITMGSHTMVAPWRHGELGWRFTAMYPKGLDCHGCGTRLPEPSTFWGCTERGDFACVERFDPGEVVEAALAWLR
jgi:ADP-heptose:LPS heptosyltransferase